MSTARTNGYQAAYREPEAEAKGDYGLLDQVIDQTNQSRHTLEEVRYMARTAQLSGMFNMSEAQAFCLMMLCEAEGLHPMQAVRRFDIIEGRPALKAAAMQAEFQRRGGRIRWAFRGQDACEAEFSHPRLHPEPLNVRVTLKELVDSGVALGKFDERSQKRVLKANYQRHPRSMLSARVISEGVRAIDPGIVVGIYTPEEVEDMRPEHDAGPEPAPRRSALRDAIAAAKGCVQPAASIESPAPPRSEFGAWLDVRIADAHAIWSRAAAGGGVDPGRPVSRQQVGRHLIKAWIAQGTLDEADVRTNGKRDPAREAAVISQAWAADPDDVAGEVDDYLSCIIRERAAAADIDLPADEDPADDAPDEAQAMADEDPAGDEWAADRE